MDRCRRIREVERWFDGEIEENSELMQHIDSCPVCSARLEQLRRHRDAVNAVKTPQEIADPQFPAFMEGIRERVESAPRRHGGVWALASVATAALIVAVSAFLVLTNGGPDKVEATVVESCSTEIEGATVTSYASDNGVATVWVNVAQDDIL